jgi:phytoene desaturase
VGRSLPIGGTGAIVRAFGRLLEELGADVRVDAEVAEIVLEGRRAVGVRLADGSVHRADAVICNADAAYTYQNLIPATRRNPLTSLRLRSMDYSNSLFVIYFGTNRRYLDSRLSHHNIMIGPDYRRQLRTIFGAKRVAEHLSLYLHMPTRTDPSIAPPGCESFYVLALVPNLDGDVDWATLAKPFRDRVMQHLEDRYLPDLQAHIVAEHHIDPRHFLSDPEQLQRCGVRGQTDPRAVGLVASPHPLERVRRPLLRRRQHPSGRGRARGGSVR